MKYFKCTLLFCSLTILFSCEPTVTFDQPQPTGKDNLSEFPKQLRGNFQSLNDNSVLNIADKAIYRVHDFDFKFHTNQLDSNYRVSGDTIINLKDNEKRIVGGGVLRKEGDTLIEHIHSVDTLFSISDNNVLRKIKGYYFLNFKLQPDNWEVEKLGLQRGQLSISRISAKQDIDLLKEISESALDSLPYQFKPTKRQFKKFVKSDGFSNSETFFKIK